MSSRLDQERESRLQPKRMERFLQTCENLKIQIISTDKTKVVFMWNGSKCTFYPYSGWHTGKTINDGRGYDNLIKQLK